MLEAPQPVKVWLTKKGDEVGGWKSPSAGGPVVPGRTYTVGEEGPERLVMGGAGGFVVPNSGGGGGEAVDMRGVEARLDRLIAAITAVPTGQTGVAAALYKAMAGAGLHRGRGMASG